MYRKIRDAERGTRGKGHIADRSRGHSRARYGWNSKLKRQLGYPKVSSCRLRDLL